jgi:hypothetical protein
MKKYFITLAFLLAAGLLTYGQSSDPLVSSCVLNAGANAKYLKDFRIQLGKSANQTDLRFKANMSLWKNTKYRFSLCNAEDSKGELILTIKDESNKEVLSTFDKKSGKVYPFVDFTCNKSGIYQLNYDFKEGQQGSGVGVVSMVK